LNFWVFNFKIEDLFFSNTDRKNAMEERWVIQDLEREMKRQKIRRANRIDPFSDMTTQRLLKFILRNQAREEMWARQDTDRVRNRVSYRKSHSVNLKEDRRWIAITKGN